jgi:anti-sigma regulatory factor (Ser/Thr protein kinase)
VLRCEHTWPATAEHVGDARASVAALATRAGVPRETVDGVRLAVSEAVSNVVLHGYRDEPQGDVTVSAEADDHRLRVTVRDEGRGLVPRTDSPGAGLGLPLIAQLTEAVSNAPGPGGHGTVVCMTFALPVAVAG